MSTTGRSPALAMPAAKATACDSQMPVSKKRSGKSARTFSSLLPWHMAAVMTAARYTSSHFDGLAYLCEIVIEIAAIVALVVSLSQLNKGSLIAPATAAIVGIHFLGVWLATANQTFVWLSIVLCCVGALAAMAPPQFRMSLSGMGSALALWLSAASTVLNVH